MRSRRQFAGIALVLPLLLASLGCVATETLPAVNGSATVQVAMEPAAGTRVAPNAPFLYGRGMLASIVLMPLDPEVLELWGRNGIEYVSRIQEADLIAVTASTLAPVVIPKGSYRLVSVTFNNFDWNVVDADPLLDPGTGKCDPATGLVTSVSFSVTPVDSSRAFAPDGDVFLDVPESGSGVLTIAIDGAALTAAIDARVSCLELAPNVWQRAAVFTGELYPADVAEFVSFR